MSLADLNEREREVVKECLQAAVEGPFFPDWEFHALFGVERKEAKSVLESWPGLDESEVPVQLAINNSFVHLLGYPHGCEKEWSRFISVTVEEFERIFDKWRGSPRMHRTRTTGEWTIVIPSDFETIDNGDSWQAYHGSRIIYVSSMAVSNDKLSAEALCAMVSKTLGQTTPTERHTFSDGHLRGEAVITRTAAQRQLKGFMCAAGTVATCIIEHDDALDDWALLTWKSLSIP